MHIYANKSPQERLALRKSEKIAKSEMFSYYVEEATKITENGTKKFEYRNGVRNDLSTPLTDMLWDRYLDNIFENDGILSGLSFNYNFLKYLSKNSSKSSEEELLGILSSQKAVDDEGPEK